MSSRSGVATLRTARPIHLLLTYLLASYLWSCVVGASEVVDDEAGADDQQRDWQREGADPPHGQQPGQVLVATVLNVRAVPVDVHVQRPRREQTSTDNHSYESVSK